LLVRERQVDGHADDVALLCRLALEHEDAKLTEKVTELSALAEGLGLKESKIPWGDVCKVIPGRSAKQCRERWVNNLDPATGS